MNGVRTPAYLKLKYTYPLLLVIIVMCANFGIGRAAMGVIYVVPLGDKIMHMIFNFFLVLVFLEPVSRKVSEIDLIHRTAIRRVGLILLFVTLEEASQYYLPNRSLDSLDLIFNWMGIGLGSVFWKFRMLHIQRLRADFSSAG